MEPNSRLKPIKEFRVYRRNLPHLELPGSAYFITFSTAEGFTLSERAKDIVISALKFHDGKKYKLITCVVMDTHAHCILQPLKTQSAQARMPVQPRTTAQPEIFYSLAQITHSIKSFSAHRIDKLLNRKSQVWQDESYDRVIRDEEEYLEKMNYIVNNPLKAGLVEKPENYRWLFYEGMEQEVS